MLACQLENRLWIPESLTSVEVCFFAGLPPAVESLWLDPRNRVVAFASGPEVTLLTAKLCFLLYLNFFFTELSPLGLQNCFFKFCKLA